MISLFIFLLAQCSFCLPFLKLKHPFLSGGDDGLDIWIPRGSAVVTDKAIKLTPLIESQKGAIWSSIPNTSPNWEANFQIAIGGGQRGGADGMAFWYVKEPQIIGDVYGSKDQWEGLAVIFDTYDNDRKGNNPYILAMVNDGTKKYDHDNDGLTQQLDGCQTDFRVSSPQNDRPVHVRVSYQNNTLWVQTTSQIRGRRYGVSGDDKKDMVQKVNVDGSEMALNTVVYVKDVVLPTGYYFGFSAATGGLYDFHDVKDVEISSEVHPFPSSDNNVKSNNTPRQQSQQNQQNQQGNNVQSSHQQPQQSQNSHQNSQSAQTQAQAQAQSQLQSQANNQQNGNRSPLVSVLDSVSSHMHNLEKTISSFSSSSSSSTSSSSSYSTSPSPSSPIATTQELANTINSAVQSSKAAGTASAATFAGSVPSFISKGLSSVISQAEKPKPPQIPSNPANPSSHLPLDTASNSISSLSNAQKKSLSFAQSQLSSTLDTKLSERSQQFEHKVNPVFEKQTQNLHQFFVEEESTQKNKAAVAKETLLVSMEKCRKAGRLGIYGFLLVGELIVGLFMLLHNAKGKKRVDVAVPSFV